MSSSSDEIRDQIERDREDAAEKIDQLEHALQDRADEVRQQAQDTVQNVRDEAEEMVQDAVETVKENLDIQQQVQNHPLPTVAAAMIGGFLVGNMMGGRKGGGGQAAQGIASGIGRAAKDSGLGETLENLAAALVGSVAEEVKTRVMPSDQGGSPPRAERAETTSTTVVTT